MDDSTSSEWTNLTPKLVVGQSSFSIKVEYVTLCAQRTTET
jgi:hypothetical protein